MLDIKHLRQAPEEAEERLRVRGVHFDRTRFLALEAERKGAQLAAETLQQMRNSQSREIGEARKRGEDTSSLVASVRDIRQRMEEAGARLDAVQDELRAFLLSLPNLPDASVPAGKDEADNTVLRHWGEPRKMVFEARDHVALAGEEQMDFAAAAKITGARFVVLRGAVARLHRALTQFMLDTHTREHGYTEVYAPYVVSTEALYGTGQLPKFEADQFRLATDEDRWLIPTAEVPVTNQYRDSLLDVTDLPIRQVCHTPCFRREAGSYGKDTRGLIRQHQFEKVEMVWLTRSEDSWDALEEMTGHAERILQRLELPYRTVMLCGGDLGFAAAKTLDLEVWLPGQGCYREISSCSNFLDFQARRMMARYRPQSGSVQYVHTLNGSGLAVGRTLAAVLENGQQADGRVRLPEALRPWMDGAEWLDSRVAPV